MLELLKRRFLRRWQKKKRGEPFLRLCKELLLILSGKGRTTFLLADLAG